MPSKTYVMLRSAQRARLEARGTSMQPQVETGTLAEGAVAVLAAADPAQKVALSRVLARRWRQGDMAIGRAPPPGRPARPERPALLPPRDMPERRNFCL